jgi:2,4-dienoyl-CoA reductase (NADPH2)
MDGPVVVFDPVGDAVGSSLVLTLAGSGRGVTMVTPDQIPGSRLGPTGALVDTSRRLALAGITIHRAAEPISVAGGKLVVRNRFTSEVFQLPCSVLVDCSQLLPNDDPVELTGVVHVGDSIAPRTAAEAVREGYLVAVSMSPCRTHKVP